jgi:hypothetical protein
MKKSLFIIAIAASLAATGCAAGYVDEQPADVVYDQGVAPGPDYVWIDGDWVWSGGRYVWHNGHWDHHREGHAWVKGNWAHTSRGYHWNGGHWN